MATPNPTITTPIALNCTKSATATLPWFVQQTEYDPAPCAFKPLVNGEEAFGAVYDAIVLAKHSVDIICWGFQPSMLFKRNGSGVPIGQLLVQKGEEGVKVRLLCWQDDIHLAEWSENNMPGNNAATAVKPHLGKSVYAHMSMLSPDYQNNTEREFDTEWYRRANLTNVTSRLPTPGALADAAVRRIDRKEAFKNFEFATRDFNPVNRIEIAWRTFWHGEDSARTTRTAAQNSASMGALEPTHHQKMVLVDYEYPDLALGFVMGHNMLDQYWDTDAHSFARMHPRFGRSGPSPWQDISSRVAGPVLQYLNDNFCQAWDDATGQSLGKSRKCTPTQLCAYHNTAGDTPLMAQVLRTQSQAGSRDIEKMYLQAVNNVTKHIFIENQYFRWPPLAEKIKEAVKQQATWGRDLAKNPIYLFVVTNSTDAAVSTGTVNTYRMLHALGRDDSIPEVSRLEQTDSLAKEQKDVEAQLEREQQAEKKVETTGVDFSSVAGAMQYLQQSRMIQQDLWQKLADIKQKRSDLANRSKQIVPTEITGLKVHVCTLVAPDSPPGNWLPVYVHAKLMTVDDAFMTLGSANINTRSMEADSELNICHDNGKVSADLRRRLWNLHTAGNGADDNLKDAFDAWSDIIRNNADMQKLGDQAPYASLVGFMRTSNVRSYSD